MILPASYSNGFAPRDGSPIYPELWTGCVGAWNPGLGNSGSVLRDWSGFGNNGTLTNGPTWSVSGGHYLYFLEGLQQYVTIPRPTQLTSTPAGSISFWMRSDNVPANCFGGFFAGDDEWLPYITRTQAYIGALRTSRVAITLSSDTGVGQWECVTFTSQPGANGWTMYRGSKIEATLTGNSTAVFPSTMQFGKSLTSSEGFTGGLKSIAMWNRCLTPREVSILATRPGIAYELAPRRRARVAVITSGFSALRPSILRGSR